tara:strand:+ start:170 stop:484 length:315 start_codon:yes stop_codon:yes gene_type:complete
MAFKLHGHTLPGIKQNKASAKKMAHSPKKAAKPDFIDIDGDGNKTESMKEAASSMKMYGSAKKMYGKSPKKNYMKMDKYSKSGDAVQFGDSPKKMYGKKKNKLV